MWMKITGDAMHSSLQTLVSMVKDQKVRQRQRLDCNTRNSLKPWFPTVPQWLKLILSKQEPCHA
jgi:hypothetical protein